MILAFVEPCWAAIRLPSMFLIPLMGLPFLTRNGEPVRVPIVSVSVRAIFSSVVSASAGATPAASTVRARVRAIILLMRVLLIGVMGSEETPQAAQKGPEARRRPTAVREAYSLYV